MKDVLFYSNFCQFSQDVLNRVMKLGIKDRFVLICVELYKSKLPPNLKVVPTIITKDGAEITDDAVYQYIDRLVNANVPRDMFTSSAAGFSFVDAEDGGYGGEDLYGVFGEDQRIETPEESEIPASMTTATRSLTFEQLQSMREMDDQNFKSSSKP